MIKLLGSTISSSHQHPSHHPNLRVKSRAHVLTACCQELRPSESMVDHYKGLEAPQFPLKNLHGMKSGASDFLTDRMAQKSRNSRSTKNSGVSFNETSLSFCRFKGGDPYQQNEPITTHSPPSAPGNSPVEPHQRHRKDTSDLHLAQFNMKSGAASAKGCQRNISKL